MQQIKGENCTFITFISLQSSTHHCWMNKGSVEKDVYLTLLYMTVIGFEHTRFFAHLKTNIVVIQVIA